MSRDGDDGVDITFTNLKFLVKDQKSGEELSILKGVSGACINSRVLAIMGSSGAGKTTLVRVARQMAKAPTLSSPAEP